MGPRHELVAWSPTGDGPRLALADDVLDAVAASPAEAIDGADLIVLAAPPLDCLALLDELAGPLRGGLRADATITDVASTKGAIVASADAHGLRFVGGHPMAGREVDGLCVRARPTCSAIGRGSSFRGGRDGRRCRARSNGWRPACGAIPMRMEAEAHDRAVAGTSHLPLVLAAALVEAVADRGDSSRPAWRPAAGAT